MGQVPWILIQIGFSAGLEWKLPPRRERRTQQSKPPIGEAATCTFLLRLLPLSHRIVDIWVNVSRISSDFQPRSSISHIPSLLLAASSTSPRMLGMPTDQPMILSDPLRALTDSGRSWSGTICDMVPALPRSTPTENKSDRSR